MPNFFFTIDQGPSTTFINTKCFKTSNFVKFNKLSYSSETLQGEKMLNFDHYHYFFRRWNGLKCHLQFLWFYLQFRRPITFRNNNDITWSTTPLKRYQSTMMTYFKQSKESRFDSHQCQNFYTLFYSIKPRFFFKTFINNIPRSLKNWTFWTFKNQIGFFCFHLFPSN